ncbi:MAG: hypothetical protein ACP5NW_05145 [Candidatus Woesearchaeota archaeon]
MTNKFKENIDKMIIGTMLGASLSFCVWAYSNRYSNLKDGYISPRNVEIRCKDIDKDGKLETIMKIYNKPYLLMDTTGKPALFEYELRPRNDTLIITK